MLMPIPSSCVYPSVYIYVCVCVCVCVCINALYILCYVCEVISILVCVCIYVLFVNNNGNEKTFINYSRFLRRNALLSNDKN